MFHSDSQEYQGRELTDGDERAGDEKPLFRWKEVCEQGMIRSPQNVLKKLVHEHQDDEVPEKSGFGQIPKAKSDDRRSGDEKEGAPSDRRPYLSLRMPTSGWAMKPNAGLMNRMSAMSEGLVVKVSMLAGSR